MIVDDKVCGEVRCQTCGYIWLTVKTKIITTCSECGKKRKKGDNNNGQSDTNS